MKAVVLHKTGDISQLKQNLLVEDVPVPEISEDEVLIKIHYASLNHRDLWITKGLYSRIKLPLILGSDCSGTIEKIGSSVENLSNGQEVIVNPSLNWGDNESHQSPAYEILGLPQNGTLAEYIKVKSEYVFPKPAHLDFEHASALPLGGLTAFRACIVKADIKPSDTVLITGTGGGVATMALLYSLTIGAKTFVTSGSDEKISQTISLGAKGGINYKSDNWDEELRDLTDGTISVVIDSSGGDTISKALDFTAYGARIVTYGATLGTVKDFDVRRVYWKQLQLLGSTMGSDKDFEDMLNFVSKHQITPIVDEIFHIDDIHKAFIRMNYGEQFGKIVIEMT